MDPPKSFHHDGLNLTYAALGPENGNPVVFHHGISGSRYTWEPIAKKLAEKGYRVYVADARGHGNSDRAPEDSYTMTKYCGDAAAFLEKVVGKPAVLVGHSLGGVQSYMTACTGKPELVKAVLLEDPPLYMTRKEVFDKTPYKIGFTFLRKDIADHQAAGTTPAEYTEIIKTRPFVPGGTLLAQDVFSEEAMVAGGKARMLMDYKAWDRTLDGTFSDHDEDVTTKVPGILLQADMSLGAAFFPEHVERFQKAAPNIKVVEYQGARHQIHDSTEFFDRFVGHLEEVLEMAYGKA